MDINYARLNARTQEEAENISRTLSFLGGVFTPFDESCDCWGVVVTPLQGKYHGESHILLYKGDDFQRNRLLEKEKSYGQQNC